MCDDLARATEAQDGKKKSAMLKHHCCFQVLVFSSDGVACQGFEQFWAELSLRAATSTAVSCTLTTLLDYDSYPRMRMHVRRNVHPGAPPGGFHAYCVVTGIGYHPCRRCSTGVLYY